ncbi:IS1501 transposase, partial [Leptospira interrogans]
LPYGARKVRKAMKHCKISGKQRKQFRPLTTNSKHGGRIAPDLVQRKFHPNEQNRIWVSDVTFIRTSFGWSYLCVILDLYSRKTVGWSLKEAEHLLFDFIEVYYNRFRFHSTLGYISPEEFETNIA